MAKVCEWRLRISMPRCRAGFSTSNTVIETRLHHWTNGYGCGCEVSCASGRVAVDVAEGPIINAGQRLLSGAWAVLFKRGPCRNLSILAEVRPLTGEPDAGDPHVRFGGRGSHKLSLPLSHRFLCFNQLMKTVVVGTAGHIDHGKSSLVKA